MPGQRCAAGCRGAREQPSRGSAGVGEEESQRPVRSSGSAGSMQGAGSNTNLWRRSPGCVRGKLLAGDTGREKRYRESKKGCGCLGLARAEEGAEHRPWPSRRQDKARGRPRFQQERRSYSLSAMRPAATSMRIQTQAELPCRGCPAPQSSCPCLPWQHHQANGATRGQQATQTRALTTPRLSACLPGLPGEGNRQAIP